MSTDVACLGRISVTPALRGTDRDQVADQAVWWAPTRRGLVLRRPGDRRAALAELRALVAHFERAGHVLHGLVVMQSADGEVFSMTVRHNRVTTRLLWTAEDYAATESCRVVELEPRRRRESRSRDLPAG